MSKETNKIKIILLLLTLVDEIIPDFFQNPLL